jgi:hypothetical protein
MSNFDVVWDRTRFNNSYADIKSNGYIKTNAKNFCMSYLHDTDLINIRDVQHNADEMVIIIIQYSAPHTDLIQSVSLRFSLEQLSKYPSMVWW